MSIDRNMNRKEFLKTAGLLGAGLGLGLSSDPLSALSWDIFNLFSSKNKKKSYAKEDGDPIFIPSPIKSVVFVNMAGGMSHVDTLDPKKDSVFSRAVSSIRGLPVSETFQSTGRHFHKLTVLRTTFSEDGDHDMGQHLLSTGYRTTDAVGIPDLPHMGGLISYAKSQEKLSATGTKKPYFPSSITMGQRRGKIGDPGYLSIDHSGFHISDPSKPLSNIEPAWGKFESDRLKRRDDFLEAINEGYRGINRSANLDRWNEMYLAAKEFRDSAKLSVFDWQKEPEKIRKKYGDSWQSRAFLLARRLAEAEVPYIQITIGGWDTHTDNKSRITKISQETDQGLAAFLDDLENTGLFRQTLFVLSSEFGRTPEVGARDGRDHHPRVWTTLIGGGNISRGRVMGETDAKGYAPAKGKDAVHVRDLVASIYQYAGVDYKKKITNTQNRPIGVAHPRSKAVKI